LIVLRNFRFSRRVLMAFFPCVLWIMLRRPGLTVLGSLVVFLGARRYGWNLAAYPDGTYKMRTAVAAGILHRRIPVFCGLLSGDDQFRDTFGTNPATAGPSNLSGESVPRAKRSQQNVGLGRAQG
jgi:OpgC protein